MKPQELPEFARFVCYGLEHHLTFDVYMDIYMDGELIESHKELLEKIDSFISAGATYKIDENGSFSAKSAFDYNGHKYEANAIIKVIANEGFVFDK